MNGIRGTTLKLLSIILLSVIVWGCHTETNDMGSWKVYKGDAAGTSYSHLDQINRQNVTDLSVTWVFHPDDALPDARVSKYECNAIVIEDRLYATSAQRWLYALDASSGEKIWSYDPFKGDDGGGICRGVTFWQDGEDQRILFTADHYLHAVHAEDGTPVTGFGIDGKVNLNEGLGMDPDSIWVIPTSPGIIYENLYIIGGEVSEYYGAAPGDIRAFDVRTGKVVWTFHTIPHPGEEGYETWPEDAWTYMGGANNWAGMCLDEERGIVYVPLGSPVYDFYGADRKGMNLFGNSLVALDAGTGRRLWHFQTVHHDVWDYDLPAPPSLVTVERDGEAIDAVAQTSKTGFVYVFDRVTGEPLFDIEEREVPPSDIPGEEVWPTQPFPVLPKPFSRITIDESDLSDRTPEIRQEVLSSFQNLRFEGIFTPPGMEGTLMVPGTRGGGEWGGVAVEPDLGLLYVNANESPEIAQIQRVNESDSRALTAVERGAVYYRNYCSSCHGADRTGLPPVNPSLVNVHERLTVDNIRNIIKSGSGRMPSFAHLSNRRVENIITFLTENVDITPGISMDTESEDGNYHNVTAYSYFRDSEGYPAIKPPWGTLNCIDLNIGAYKWSVTLGDLPDARHEDEDITGAENYGGPVVTAGGLVFIAATVDKKFRAFDKETGELLWEYTLPAPGYASPSTYMIDGRQYLTLCVSGTSEHRDGSIMAFALP